MKVDAIALESVIHNAPALPEPDTIGESFDKLVRKVRGPSRTTDLREKVVEPIEARSMV